MDNKSEHEDHDGDRAEESTPEMKIAEIDPFMSEGCGCSNENSISVLGAQSMVTIQHQVCK